uniref:SNARE-complex protein Syntaxin-18 N-terminal domain-containing protein n=1 Tax=Dendroctonus ponderosae TaxID=77166 RepID=J3JVS3_DENPD|nr:unknown [Dendroctonus ponderosae]
MDLTTLFKACVKTVKVTNKSLGLQEAKSNILKINPKDGNLTKAKEIVKHISSLQTYLLGNKAAYLNVLNYLSTNKTMTEIDRENVDEKARSIISACTDLINEYKRDIRALQMSKQKEEHYQCIVESLEVYLKSVSKIYAEAKAVRVKRVIETYKLSKLEIQPSRKESLDIVNAPKDGSGDFSKKSLSSHPVN